MPSFRLFIMRNGNVRHQYSSYNVPQLTLVHFRNGNHSFSDRAVWFLLVMSFGRTHRASITAFLSPYDLIMISAFTERRWHQVVNKVPR